MEKIKLKMEELKVESFNVVNEDSNSQGTVIGNRPTPYSACGDLTCGNTGCGDCASDGGCYTENCSNYDCETVFTCANPCTMDIKHCV